MGTVFTPLDAGVFFAALALVMAIGLLASRRENTAEAYFLAGRNIPWWGVAGSIYGSNVSANHMIGMMGIGFSVGFAQSHFELGAIAGLILLCYGFLPVYRKLKACTVRPCIFPLWGIAWELSNSPRPRWTGNMSKGGLEYELERTMFDQGRTL